MSALLRVARRISPARFDADYSYLGTRLAGDRWVAVGDAAAFLDPIFSTGVLLAMQSGLDAAAAIDAGLAGGELSARHFAGYARLVRRRYRHFRRFAVTSVTCGSGAGPASASTRPCCRCWPVTGDPRSPRGSGSMCSSRWWRSSACSPSLPEPIGPGSDR